MGSVKEIRILQLGKSVFRQPLIATKTASGFFQIGGGNGIMVRHFSQKQCNNSDGVCRNWSGLSGRDGQGGQKRTGCIWSARLNGLAGGPIKKSQARVPPPH